MTRILLAMALPCCLVGASAVTAQQPVGAGTALEQVSTLRLLDPGIAGKIGFNNPSYAALVATGSPADPATAGVANKFTAPDEKVVTFSIAPPKVDGTYPVPPMQPGEDPTVYFANAIAHAGSHKTIVFPKGGVYNFAATACQKAGAHLKISSATDVVIDGNGSLLNFATPCPGVALMSPTRIVFKNFTIDWPTLRIASLGTIVAAGGSGPRRFTYDVQLDPEYVSSTMPPNYKSINSWDSEHGYWSVQHPDHEVGYSPRQPLSATGSARNVQSWAARFTPGEHVIIRHYTTEGDALDIYHGQDVTLENITIYSSPGFGMTVLQGSSGLAVSNCKITRAPGRIISTAADALHIDNYAGNVLIENSTFAYQGDDGLNMNTTLFPVANAGTSEIPVPENHGYIRQGDPIALFNSEMRFDDSTTWHIASLVHNPANHTNTLTLDHVIPPADKGGFLVDLNFSGARYIVRNNQFLHNRARGALLQTSYGLVEGNTFAGQTMFPLFLTTFPPEGPGAQNVIVANNKISDSGVDGGPAAVVVARAGTIYSPASHNPPVHQNILFIDNVISDVPGAAFYISSANNVILYHNTLRNTNYEKVENKWNGAGDINSPVVINDASNILLRSNSIQAPSSRKNPVAVDAGTTTGVRISTQ